MMGAGDCSINAASSIADAAADIAITLTAIGGAIVKKPIIYPDSEGNIYYGISKEA